MQLPEGYKCEELQKGVFKISEIDEKSKKHYVLITEKLKDNPRANLHIDEDYRFEGNHPVIFDCRDSNSNTEIWVSGSNLFHGFNAKSLTICVKDRLFLHNTTIKFSELNDERDITFNATKLTMNNIGRLELAISNKDRFGVLTLNEIRPNLCLSLTGFSGQEAKISNTACILAEGSEQCKMEIDLQNVTEYGKSLLIENIRIRSENSDAVLKLSNTEDDMIITNAEIDIGEHSSSIKAGDLIKIEGSPKADVYMDLTDGLNLDIGKRLVVYETKRLKMGGDIKSAHYIAIHHNDEGAEVCDLDVRGECDIRLVDNSKLNRVQLDFGEDVYFCRIDNSRLDDSSLFVKRSVGFDEFEAAHIESFVLDKGAELRTEESQLDNLKNLTISGSVKVLNSEFVRDRDLSPINIVAKGKGSTTIDCCVVEENANLTISSDAQNSEIRNTILRGDNIVVSNKDPFKIYSCEMDEANIAYVGTVCNKSIKKGLIDGDYADNRIEIKDDADNDVCFGSGIEL